MRRNQPIDIAILEYMAEQCPIGREAEFILGLSRLGFSGAIPAYREAVLRGLVRRGQKGESLDVTHRQQKKEE